VVAISEECGVPINERRAEELSPEEFTRLTDALQTKKSLNK
jgi:hypothetical protein